MGRIRLGVGIGAVLGVVLLGTTKGSAQDAAQPIGGTAVDPRTAPAADESPWFVTPEEPAPDASPCPADMALVEGDHCKDVGHECLRWLDPETRMRCAEFARTSTCLGKPIHKRVCVDRYEWPNRRGERPTVMVSWLQAKDACDGAGKRLCGDSEWTLACEGNERLPYPYGWDRDAEACNIDKPHPYVNVEAMQDPARRDAEVQRLDQRDPSGERARCVSPFGVHDMTGNVDEWVVNESGKPFASGLKGGYWGPVRTRCRPMTTAHNELFAFYQIGFRCCRDARGL